VRAAILDATTALLAEASYDELRIEDVARRAGVNKTTVYRRWPTKVELVADAVRAQSRQSIPVPDTGSFAGDLSALARSVATHLGSAGGARMTRTMVAAATTTAEVSGAMPAFWAHRFALVGTIVERAVERGELPADVDADLLIETLIGPLYVRLLLTGAPITVEVAERVAALVTAGAEQATRRSDR
jgi:AcrR family transcriptional regulator